MWQARPLYGVKPVRRLVLSSTTLSTGKGQDDRPNQRLGAHGQVISDAETADGPVLDLATFREATGVGNKAFATGLVTRFEASIREDRVPFEAMIAAPDMAEAARLAHRCLGLCQVLGAAALAQGLRRLKQEAAVGNVGEVRALAADCETVAETTLREMRAALTVSGTGGA